MTETMIALITAVGAFLAGAGGIISAILLNRKTSALLEYRMKEVERKLDSHNGYAQRFAENSEQLASLKTDIEIIKNDLKWIKEERK